MRITFIGKCGIYGNRSLHISADHKLNLGWPFPISLLIGCLAPGIIALTIGIPVLRLSDVYLAIATLAFGEVVRVILLNLQITGGSMGLNNVPMLTKWYHIVILLSLTIYIVHRLYHSRSEGHSKPYEKIKQPPQ